METVDWVEKHADPDVKAKLPELNLVKAGTSTFDFINHAVEKQQDRAARGKVHTDVVRGTKGWNAYGAFDPAGTQLLIAGKGPKAYLWDLAAKKGTQTFIGHDRLVSAVAFHPKAAQVLLASEDGIARLYDIDPKKAELELKNDKLAALKAEYDKSGREPSNLRYGYVAEPVTDFSVFG